MNVRKDINRARSGALLVVAAVLALWLFGANAAENAVPAVPVATNNGAVSPKDEANALHLIIAADREIYCREYLMHTVNPSARSDWPLPSEMFRHASESVQSNGAEFSYALRSLRPIDPRNGPQTELEQRGLEFIASNPTRIYYGQEMLGGRRYFTGVYPDLPASAACIECHNRRLPPAAKPWRAGASLGGVVVRVPLEF